VIAKLILHSFPLPLCPWPLALVQPAVRAWKDTTADSAPLLLQANINLIPEAVLLAFHMAPTDIASPEEVDALKEIAHVAASWWKLQRESMQRLGVLATDVD